MPPGQKIQNRRNIVNIFNKNIVHIKKIIKKIKKPVTKDQTFSDSIYAGLE